MATFASMQSLLLRAGGTRIGHRPMMATIYAANALAVSVPVAGPELGTAFTFRRFTKQGADTSLASWALLVGGLVSSVGAILVLAVGGALSGNVLVAGLAICAGFMVVGLGGAVRTAAGLFDLSHMGEFEVAGPHALDLLERALTNSAARLREGQAQYTILCAPDGGTIDDLIVYRLGAERFMLCVNASNIDADREWLLSLNRHGAKFRDLSDETALIAACVIG